MVQEYKKYRWFYTSTGKLVIGGKSAQQNDDLIKMLKQEKKDYIVMHTSHPGSPFSVITDASKITEEDIKECSIFTGCFSRAWKEGKRKTEVHIFRLRQLHKEGGMKVGTWGVKGRVDKAVVPLELALVKQKGVLRAVPIAAGKMLMKICPGKIDKSHMVLKLQVELGDAFTREELLSALPAGGVRICR